MNRFLIIAALCSTLILTGCASPAERMSPTQVASLSDLQLCQLNNGYNFEQKTYVEIGRRGLNCDPAHVVCASRGIHDKTPEMDLCVGQVRLQQAQAAQMQAIQRHLREQRREIEHERNMLELERLTVKPK